MRRWRWRRGHGIGALALAGTIAAASAAPAQGPASSGRSVPRVLVVGSTAFEQSCLVHATGEPGLRRGAATIGGCSLTATLTLPETAEVVAVEADVCDTSTVGDVLVSLVRAVRLTTSQAILAAASTAGTPGCVTLTLVPAPPASADGAYLGVIVELGDSTSPEQVTVQGLRVHVVDP